MGDALGGLAGLLLGGKSVWIMAPSYVVAYVVLLWVIAFTVKVLDGRAEKSMTAAGPRASLDFA